MIIMEWFLQQLVELMLYNELCYGTLAYKFCWKLHNLGSAATAMRWIMDDFELEFWQSGYNKLLQREERGEENQRPLTLCRGPCYSAI